MKLSEKAEGVLEVLWVAGKGGLTFLDPGRIGTAIPPVVCCDKACAQGDLGIVPLTEFKSGQDGEIAYIQTEDHKKMQKLMAMGVLPGNRITLAQSFPSYIFRVGYSEFAIDTNLAREIFVRK